MLQIFLVDTPLSNLWRRHHSLQLVEVFFMAIPQDDHIFLQGAMVSKFSFWRLRHWGANSLDVLNSVSSIRLLKLNENRCTEAKIVLTSWVQYHQFDCSELLELLIPQATKNKQKSVHWGENLCPVASSSVASCSSSGRSAEWNLVKIDPNSSRRTESRKHKAKPSANIHRGHA